MTRGLHPRPPARINPLLFSYVAIPPRSGLNSHSRIRGGYVATTDLPSTHMRTLFPTDVTQVYTSPSSSSSSTRGDGLTVRLLLGKERSKRDYVPYSIPAASLPSHHSSSPAMSFLSFSFLQLRLPASSLTSRDDEAAATTRGVALCYPRPGIHICAHWRRTWREIVGGAITMGDRSPRFVPRERQVSSFPVKGNSTFHGSRANIAAGVIIYLR